MRFILIILIFCMSSCKKIDTQQNKVDLNDPNVPVLKLTEICLEGIVYYVGYHIDKDDNISGGPMTPKFVQDNLFPVRCENNLN